MDWRARIAGAVGRPQNAAGEYEVRPDEDDIIEGIVAAVALRRGPPGAVVFDEHASMEIAHAAVISGAAVYRTHGECYDRLTAPRKRRLRDLITEGGLRYEVREPDGSADYSTGAPPTGARALRRGGMHLISDNAEFNMKEAEFVLDNFERDESFMFRNTGQPASREPYTVTLWKKK